MWRLAIPLPEYPRVMIKSERDEFRRKDYLLFGADSESDLEMYVSELKIILQDTQRELAKKKVSA